VHCRETNFRISVIRSNQSRNQLFSIVCSAATATVAQAGARPLFTLPRKVISISKATGSSPMHLQGMSSRMAGAPAQEEIDEPTGKFLRPRSDIVHLELLA
jgi:hypothetical protein